MHKSDPYDVWRAELVWFLGYQTDWQTVFELKAKKRPETAPGTKATQLAETPLVPWRAKMIRKTLGTELP
ncbi:hypothetical protein [uncultured Roseobacter sp.]|uniref:hypothetical protein n=1 Tax=uncultured Roseobacter sp. TaxID=114847 RepID=UPI002623744B|nr:hypothetical protein [uncultured Roseobacter sp.]